MVREARNLRPTDLLALLTHNSIGYENQAWPRERLGARDVQPTLSVLRDQLLVLARRRRAWVSMRRQRLQGLVGARPRGGYRAWEIDYFVDSSGDDSVLVDLLSCAVQGAGRNGAEKLFLRLLTRSSLLRVAREVGFQSYLEESLYVGIPDGHAYPVPLREAEPSDNYPLYCLYNAATPEAARRSEAATYDEWQASLERNWLKDGAQFVYEDAGEIRALIRAARLPQGLMLDLLVDGAKAVDAPSIIAGTRRAMQAMNVPVLVLVPSTAEGLARSLEDAGCLRHSQFVSLMHRTTRPIAMPKAVPAVAKTAVGA
jgi:hypothetical protein